MKILDYTVLILGILSLLCLITFLIIGLSAWYTIPALLILLCSIFYVIGKIINGAIFIGKIILNKRPRKN